MPARTLTCPLCRGDASAAIATGGGRCPACDSAIAGGGATPTEAVAAALEAWGLDGIDAGALARRLFETEPAAAPEPAAAIASDEGEGFYSWWVAVRAAGDDGPRAVLEGLVAA